jgi:hypothetical protein
LIHLGRVMLNPCPAQDNSIGPMAPGPLALMATLVVRVTVLALGWRLVREWRFLTVALVVFGLMGLSLAVGLGLCRWTDRCLLP